MLKDKKIPSKLSITEIMNLSKLLTMIIKKIEIISKLSLTNMHLFSLCRIRKKFFLYHYFVEIKLDLIEDLFFTFVLSRI